MVTKLSVPILKIVTFVVFPMALRNFCRIFHWISMFIVEHSAVDHCNALVGVKYFLPDHNHKEERALSVVKNFINIIYLFGY